LQGILDSANSVESKASQHPATARLAGIIGGGEGGILHPHAVRMGEIIFDLAATLARREPKFHAADSVVAREADGRDRFATVSKVYFFGDWWRYVVIYDDGTEAVLCEAELRRMSIR